MRTRAASTRTARRLGRRGLGAWLLLVAVGWLAGALPTRATPVPPELLRIDIVEHLGDRVPLDLTFTNATGQVVPLRQYIDGKKPVVLVLAYYDCPLLCGLVLSGAAGVAKEVDFVPGTDYHLLTVSVNPLETAAMAAKAHDKYLAGVPNASSPDAWAFLVGQDPQIHQLADAVGFKYFYDEATKQYAHPAALIVLTPDGRISRYLYGIQYKPQQLRLALLEAGEGKIGTVVDRLVLYCYHYDPTGKGYTLMATRVMRLGGLLTLIIVGVGLVWFWRREQRTPKVAPPPPPAAAA